MVVSKVVSPSLVDAFAKVFVGLAVLIGAFDVSAATIVTFVGTSVVVSTEVVRSSVASIEAVCDSVVEAKVINGSEVVEIFNGFVTVIGVTVLILTSFVIVGTSLVVAGPAADSVVVLES